MQEVSCLVEVLAVCLVEGSVALAALVDLCQAWEVSQELLLECPGQLDLLQQQKRPQKQLNTELE